MSSIARFACLLSFIILTPFSHALTPPAPSHVLSDVLALHNGDLLLHHSHGVFRRSGSDIAWKQVLEAREIRQLLVYQNDIYAPASSALYFSSDEGRTWTKREAHQINSIGDDGTLYGCAERGEEASKDLGQTWQSVGPGQVFPRTHSLWCATKYDIARHKEGEYAIDGHENRLYYRSGPGERWIARSLEKQFANNQLLMRLVVDRNGVLYMNVATKVRDWNNRDSGKIYMSRDKGERWEALSLHASAVKPRDLQIWGVWNGSLLMTCAEPGGSFADHLCEAADGDPNNVAFRGPFNNHSNLSVGPDGVIYSLDRYSIRSLGRNEQDWQELGLEGVPESFGQVRK